MVRMKFPLQHDNVTSKTMIKMGKDGKQMEKWQANKEMKGKSKLYVVALVYFIDSTHTSGLTVIICQFLCLVHLQLC